MENNPLSQPKNKERIVFLDIARGIAILIVVAGHLLQKDTNALNHGKRIYELIYSFHMPAFFVLSGMGMYLSLGTKQMTFELFKDKLKKYTKKLLLSYFLWSLISYCISCVAYKPDPVKWFWLIFTFRGRAPIWFLGALFWGEAAFLLIHYFAKNKLIGSIIAVILSGIATAFGSSIVSRFSATDNISVEYTIISVARFFPVLLFICCGFLIMHIIRTYDIASYYYFIAGIIFAGVLLFVQIKSNNSVNLHTYVIDNIYIFLLTSLSGSLSLVCICKAISGLLPFRLLSALGKNSLGIMLIHYEPFHTMNHAWEICGLLPAMPKIATFLVVLAITTAIAYFFTAMINKKLFVR